MKPRVLGAMVMAAALATIAAPRVVRAEGTLAVFRIDPLGVSAEIVARLEALLRMELGRLADAALPSPGQIQRLVARHRKLSGCTGGVHCLARAGALLKVKRIISGNVGGLGDSYVLNIKLVDVGAKKEVRRIQETMSGHPDQLIEAVRVAAYRLVAPERLRGSLEVLANVAGATVALDGKELGATPLAIQHNLLVGEHTLRVTKAGYSDVLQEIKVRLQKTARIVVKMQVPKGGGNLPPKREKTIVPFYTRWWFWGAVTAVAIGVGIGLGVAFSSSPTVDCVASPQRCGL
ncbi:MAG: PEGA domain-containing protein [Myxococcales bacterium]|nr:PEGA domain-containing protein [Myxococcales bacterium]